MEVFPALSLASYSPAFFGYRKGPRYNPDRKTFRIEDWIATIDAAINEATRFSCLQLVAWLNGLRSNLAPRKVDQDRLDSALCLLVAMRWRLSPREMSVFIGDLRNGYMVAPVSATVMRRLDASGEGARRPDKRFVRTQGCPPIVSPFKLLAGVLVHIIACNLAQIRRKGLWPRRA